MTAKGYIFHIARTEYKTKAKKPQHRAW